MWLTTLGIPSYATIAKRLACVKADTPERKLTVFKLWRSRRESGGVVSHI